LVARIKDSRSWPRGLREANEARDGAGSPPSGNCSSKICLEQAWPLVVEAPWEETAGSFASLRMTFIPNGSLASSGRGWGGARLKGVASAGWSGSESGNSETGSTSAEALSGTRADEAREVSVSAAIKLAAGRAFINVMRMLSRTKS
jgi:hypothetical protein